MSIFKNKNKNRHSQVVSEIESSKKKENKNEGSFSGRKWEMYFHVPSLQLLWLLLGVFLDAQGSFLVHDHTDISSREGKMVDKQCISPKGKHLFGARSNVLPESWIPWLQLRCSIWCCESHQSTRQGKLVFTRALPWDWTGLEPRLCLSFRWRLFPY